MSLMHVALVALLVASGSQMRFTPASAPADLQPAVARADAAFARLQQALMSQLTTELNKGDALTAFSACHDSAPQIAREVREAEGIALGRTSHRLRNPDNVAPAWAEAHVAEAAGRPLAEAKPLVVDLNDRVGVLRPIPTAAVCTTCHGPAEQIAPDIRETISALYPGDRATGFREGDLRGWMWAEVPKN